MYYFIQNTMLFTLYFIATALAAYVPSDNYSTLTPAAKPTGTTDYTTNFGIQIETVTSAAAKRDVNQIGDGQIQNQSVTGVINQIGDGQIQNQSATPTPSPTINVVNQIGDGQIQHQSETTVVSVINQINDGQIQNQSAAPTASVIHQINDGQIQNQSADAASQINDGQIQNSAETGAPAPEAGKLETCATANGLSMSLKDSILTDSKGRIGAIVANRQFQFDGPPPQAGSIYAAGWAIDDGFLALGTQTEFWQCKSGDFYNLYDENVAAQCEPVKLAVVDFINC